MQNLASESELWEMLNRMGEDLSNLNVQQLGMIVNIVDSVLAILNTNTQD